MVFQEKLPYKPVVPLQGMYPKDSVSHHRDTWTALYIAALVNSEKEVGPTWLSINRWVDNENVRHIQGEILFNFKEK